MRAVLALAFALAVAGCGGAPPSSSGALRVAGARELGPIAFLPVIRGRDGGYSARFGGRSAWVFGDTILGAAAEDGATWRSSTASWTVDSDAADGIGPFEQRVDARGVPLQFVPYTAEENAFDAAHSGSPCPAGGDCGARWALWPGPVVDDGTGHALVFYQKVSARPGAFNFRTVGTSLATWTAPDAALVRPPVRPGALDPTLLFPDGEPGYGAAALVEDGVLYAYACALEYLTFHCTLGRVPVARALDRGAWTFFAGFAGGGRWDANFRAAIPTIDAAAGFTVHRSPHLGRYLAVYSKVVSDEIAVRTAARLEGPWSDEQVVAKGVAPDDRGANDYLALAHPELAVDGGRREYITYARPGKNFTGELRLVELTLE